MKQSFFVGIGAQKCASTWIYDVLQDHPEVCLSKEKEIDFFSYRYGYGYQWYERNWSHCDAGKLRGEVSPSYFCEPAVPSRLKAYAPDTKIILSLRDPVDRAISNHKHEVRSHNFRGDDITFEAGLKNNPNYVNQSRYGLHLANWLEHFSAERILILLLDDIIIDAAGSARSIYRFLGIDPEHSSAALDTKSNESHSFKLHTLESVRRYARETIRVVGLDRVWHLGQRAGLQNLYRRINRVESTDMIPRVPETLKDELRSLFQDDIVAVEKVTGRSLPKWKTGASTKVPETV